jgi:hypothetical protein
MGMAARRVHVSDIARARVSRREAARKSLTEWRVRPGPGRACVIPLLSTLILAHSSAAFAGPTPCQGLGGVSVTCTGNQMVLSAA